MSSIYPTGKIIVAFVICFVFYTMCHFHAMPHKDRQLNKQESFNEVSVQVLAYQLIGLKDLVECPQTKITTVLSLIFTIGLNMMFGIGTIIFKWFNTASFYLLRTMRKREPPRWKEWQISYALYHEINTSIFKMEVKSRNTSLMEEIMRRIIYFVISNWAHVTNTIILFTEFTC